MGGTVNFLLKKRLLFRILNESSDFLDTGFDAHQMGIIIGARMINLRCKLTDIFKMCKHNQNT